MAVLLYIDKVRGDNVKRGGVELELLLKFLGAQPKMTQLEQQ